jgi:hypothetical protein
MRLTEECAKTKWCPMHQAVSPPDTNCVASNCMFWRWARRDDEPEMIATDEDRNPKGYCGLAGKP